MTKAKKKPAATKRGKVAVKDEEEPISVKEDIHEPEEETVAEEAIAPPDAEEVSTAIEQEDALPVSTEVPVKVNDHEEEEGEEEAAAVEDVTVAAVYEEEAAAAAESVAQATAAAVEAAVAAASVVDAATAVQDVVTETAAAVAASMTAVAERDGTNEDGHPQPTDRDVILGEGSAGHKTNLLLQDVIRLHRILWKLHDKPLPTSAADVEAMAMHIINIVKKGKMFELAGLKDVPKPFMRSTGRFFGKDAATGAWKVLNDEALTNVMTEIILDEFKVDDLGPLTEAPFSDLKEWMLKTPKVPATDFLPEAKDAILLPVDQEAEKMYESQQGNKTLFHLASQLVTSHTNSPDKRVEAALSIMKGLDETLESIGSGNSMAKLATTTLKARFFVRTVREDCSVAWHLMDPASAAEFTVIFVFEVFLEKEIHITATDRAYLTGGSLLGFDDQEDEATNKPSTVPIHEPTDHDVLFGRGGMTNSHPGNRRFRDIIALHRPDYIRAVKMDKPGVARKIVKAIRLGIPQGRFLKKADDGMYYDVGDRTAAEKTSQGLRERTNAEKRQRSALREALRIRKEDLTDGDEADDGANKKAKTGDEPASIPPTLNYIGTNLPVPLSLNMKDVSSAKNNVVRVKKPKNDKLSAAEELNCEGLPPNAVDEEGNILVTDHDILCGRGGLTNHHKGNKRFRDIVALHRPDYVRAPKIQKPSVARVIVRAIRSGDPAGRFLRKDERTGKWVDIGDKKAAEKTSQALREKTNDERDAGNPTETLGGVLLPNSYLAGTVPAMVLPVSIPAVMAPPEAPTNETKAEEISKVETKDAKKPEGEDLLTLPV